MTRKAAIVYTALYLGISFLVVSINSFGQPPPFIWTKTYTGNLYDVSKTADNSLIEGGDLLSGTSPQTGYSVYRQYFIKSDTAGNVIWSLNTTPVTGLTSHVSRIRQGPDGRYYFAGYASANVYNPVPGYPNWFDDNYNLSIGILNQTGSLVFSKLMGSAGNNNDFGYSIDFAQDGSGYTVAGAVEANGGDVTGYQGGGADGWIIKHDFSNNVVWNKCFGGTGFEYIYSIAAVNSGGYIGIGTASNTNINGYHLGFDAWVLRIAENGDIIWSKCFGGSGHDNGSSIITTSDGGFVIAGITNSTDGDVAQSYGDHDVWLVKLDANGSIQWQKNFGGALDDQPFGLMELEDGNFMFYGISFSTDHDLAGISNPGNQFPWLVKVDKNTRQIIWQKRYSEFASMRNIGKDFDGNFYVAGGPVTKLLKECLVPITNNLLNYSGNNSFCVIGDPSSIIGSIPSGGLNNYIYQWQQSTDGTNYSNISGATSQDYDPGNTTQTTYFRRVVSSGGCTVNNSSPVIITINASPPTPIITPGGPTTVCGSSVLLTSSSTSDNQWYKDNSILTNETNPTYTAAASGVYTVTVTNAAGCTSTSVGTTVTVNTNPTTPIITPGGATTFCNGNNVQLSSSYASGNQWFKEGNSISMATNQQYTATASGGYTVGHTDVNGCSALSAIVTVTVNPLPATPAISVIGALNFCPGGNVTLTSSAANGNQWYKNNVDISNATNNTFIAAEPGSYTVKTTDGTCLSLASSPVVVNVMDCNFPTNPYVISSIDSNTYSSGVTFSAIRRRPLTDGLITYFAAYKNYIQSEPGLWKTDGTGAGTILVKSIGLYNTDFIPENLTKAGDTIFFTISDYNTYSTTQLWRTDGSEEGTVLVKEFVMGNSNYYIKNLVAVGNKLFFTKQDSLFKSDGTSDGTVLVKAGMINNAQTEGNYSFAAYNGELFFNGYDATNGEELWKSNGTAAGTIMIKNIRAGSLNSAPVSLIVSNGNLFFVTSGASGRELWKSDDTGTGTGLVKAILNFSSASGKPYLYEMNGVLFFMATNAGSDYELWKSDGSTVGTIVVKDINPGTTNSSFPQYITPANGFVYFSATTPATGYELWKSDGTDAGTVLIKDIFPGNSSSSPLSIIYSNGLVYFSANGGTATGNELWGSDGTNGGTALVKDINPGTANSFPGFFASSGTNMFMMADNGGQGIEPWISDGTAGGTFLLKDINTYPSSINSGPLDNFTNNNGLLYFAGQSTVNGTSGVKHIWKSNGADTGTKNVTVLYSNTNLGNSDFNNLTSYYNELVFGASGLLYKTDGINTANLNLTFNPGRLVKSGSKLYFIASSVTPPSANALYVTDATVGNSIKLCDTVINPSNNLMTDVNGTLFFVGYKAASGYELWKTDGTVGGTMLVKDILPGNTSSNINEMVNVNGILYFRTTTQIWKSDGTAGGTELLATFTASPFNLHSFNGKLYFAAFSAGTGIELWTSDGTAAGTVLLKDINAGVNNSFDNNSTLTRPQFTVAGNTLFFVADNGTVGRELWKTDGTAGGTMLVKDIMKGALSSDLNYLTGVAGFLCFAAKDSAHGTELWTSNGSEVCTNMVSDLQPSSQNGIPDGSQPKNLTDVNGVLYFSAVVSYSGNVLLKYNPLLPTTLNALYSFSGDGDWNNSTNWCNNNLPPLVLPKGSEIIIKTAPGGECRLTGTQTISNGAKLTIVPGANLVVAGNLIMQ